MITREDGVESLEERRLFAVDLVPVLTVRSTYVLSTLNGGAGDLVYDLAVANKGTSAYGGSPIPVKYVLSKDKTIGNADDFQFFGTLEDNGEPPREIPPGLEVGEPDTVEVLPSGIVGGRYYLAVTLDPDNLIAESNNDNNSVISSTNAVTIVTSESSESIMGTDGDDKIVISQPSRDAFVTMNGKTRGIPWATLSKITINGGLGDDDIRAFDNVTVPLIVSGAAGNDTLVGGGENDILSGGNGKDKLYGNSGNDLLIGGANPDTLNGMDGNDTCSGGGGNDRLIAFWDGQDYLIGGIGNDVFVANDAQSGDTLSGGAGTDNALIDQGDEVHSIEMILT